jgi:hypothetical protein
MKRTCFVLLVVALSLAARDAVAARPCDITTIVGTYAGFGDGSLWVGTADSRTIDPASVPHPAMAPPFMPAALIGVFTVMPDGTVEAQTWSGLGTTWFPDLRFTGTVTVNPDCTGHIVSSPLGGPVPNIETFVILDKGRQMRSIYAQSPEAPPLAVAFEYVRLGGPGHHRNGECRQVDGAGDWVMTCNGITPTPTPAGVMSLSASMLARFRVSGEGDITGTVMHKVGPGFTAQAFAGTITVHDDCTFDSSLDFHPELPITFSAKGVLYDRGTRGAAMPMVATTDTPGGPVEAPMPARLCRLVRP